MGLVSQVVRQDVLERMPGDLAIGPTAIRTTGQQQGLPMPSPSGACDPAGPAFALAHNG